jgi:hypothetical protein
MRNAAVGTVHMVWRVHEESETEEVLELLKDHHRLFFLYYLDAASLALMCASICSVENFRASYRMQGP